jgi:hypothetical protein
MGFERSTLLLALTLISLGAACAGEATLDQADSGPVTRSATEVCDGFDNDGDGNVDEGCACKAGTTAACYPGPAEKAGVGICKQGSHTCTGDAEFGGWGPCTGAVFPASEICGNSIDEDCDGKDLACAPDGGLKPDSRVPGKEAGPVKDCTPGQQRACYTGPAGTVGKGPCKAGNQVCDSNGSWTSTCVGEVLPAAEVCNNTIDEDCNGQAALCPGTVAVPVNIDGDCVTATCPGSAPYPVGCKIDFQGGDPRGCVANVPNNSTVYFQEGNECGAGHLTGVLYCSSQKGSGLSASNCPINKSQIFYPSSKSGCPPT